MKSHLEELRLVRDGFLRPREIELDLNFEDGFAAEILAFETDIDGIFNNLILNSFEAFVDGISMPASPSSGPIGHGRCLGGGTAALPRKRGSKAP
jgi:hypothetical protein